ncbi:MAG: sugar phosphate isomerase/epimerase [Planctomycetaceae bacterium]|nr:sugar phosphate isomerase/epimerase [Planctomycetaceae bacterium]
MKIAGHTMGTPEYTLDDAARLFQDCGFDGIEIVVQDGYRCALPPKDGHARAEAVASLVADMGMETSCLTPYASDFNSLDPAARAKAEADLRIVIDYARILRAPFIRIYGGTLLAGDTENYEHKLDNLVDSMRRLGDVAAAAGVTLVLENHFSTMTVSAAAAAMIVGRIAHPAVGILYDQANLTFGKEEDWRTAMDLQHGMIKYVHVKDLRFKNPDAPLYRVQDKHRRSRNPQHRHPYSRRRRGAVAGHPCPVDCGRL